MEAVGLTRPARATPRNFSEHRLDGCSPMRQTGTRAPSPIASDVKRLNEDFPRPAGTWETTGARARNWRPPARHREDPYRWFPYYSIPKHLSRLWPSRFDRRPALWKAPAF